MLLFSGPQMSLLQYYERTHENDSDDSNDESLGDITNSFKKRKAKPGSKKDSGQSSKRSKGQSLFAATTTHCAESRRSEGAVPPRYKAALCLMQR